MPTRICVWTMVCLSAAVTLQGAWKTRADAPPRKVVIASAQLRFGGTPEERLEIFRRGFEEASRTEIAGERGLDLVVFPEFALQREAREAADQAIGLDEPIVRQLREIVRQHRAWTVAPITLREADGERCSNAAVLFDRAGEVAGVFRKVHPMVDPDGRFEAGVTPGAAYPVFECDFGRVGILICWDMSYPEAWTALAEGGAEIVALPSASPQTLRPAAEALRHCYYVVTSTPRDNAALFDPIGRTVAQVTESGMLVHEVDLSYAVVHWSETLRNGQALTERYGDRVDGSYSSREDTGIFWSNDPAITIGEMMRELELREMPVTIETVKRARNRAVGAAR
ncbi:MAG: carbon-nitrogen hydrolase family protein [Opitutus sp.]|nr:carbon-nitrogen hydrolase family protein [Opitutus sp.]